MSRSSQARKQSRNDERVEDCKREGNNDLTQRQASIKFESKNTIFVLPGRGNKSMEAVTFLQFPGMYYLKMNQTYMQQCLNDLKDELEYHHGSKLARITTQNQVLIICSSKFGKSEQGRKKQKLDQYLECPYCVKFDLEPRDGYYVYRLTYMNFQHCSYCDAKQIKVFYRNKGILNRYYPQIKKLVLMKKARQETLESPNQLYEIFCRQLGLNPGIITQGFEDKENETPYENDLKKKLKKKLDNIIAEAKREALNPEDYLSKQEIKKIYGDQDPFEACSKKYETSTQLKKQKYGNKPGYKLKKKSYPLKLSQKQKPGQSQIICTEVKGKKRSKPEKNVVEYQRYGRKISSKQIREFQTQGKEMYSDTPVMSTRGLRYNLKEQSNEDNLSSESSDDDYQRSQSSKKLECEEKRQKRKCKNKEYKEYTLIAASRGNVTGKKRQHLHEHEDLEAKGQNEKKSKNCFQSEQNQQISNKPNRIPEDQLENQWRMQCSDRADSQLFLNENQKFFEFEQSHRYPQNYLDMLSDLSQINQSQKDDISIRIREFLEPKVALSPSDPNNPYAEVEKQIKEECQSHAFFEE